MEANFYRLVLASVALGFLLGACGMGVFLWIR